MKHMIKHSLSTRILHWVCALIIIALFISGWIMVDLDYYSPWYTTLPEWHITGGVAVLLLWLLMILRLWLPRKRLPDLNHKPLESWLAKITQLFLFLLVSVIIICGYLITTADGSTKEILGWLKLPAISHFNAQQVDTMGWLHENLSYVMMVMVVLPRGLVTKPRVLLTTV